MGTNCAMYWSLTIDSLSEDTRVTLMVPAGKQGTWAELHEVVIKRLVLDCTHVLDLWS